MQLEETYNFHKKSFGMSEKELEDIKVIILFLI